MKAFRVATIGLMLLGAAFVAGGMGQSRGNPPPIMPPSPSLSGGNGPSMGRPDSTDPLAGRMEEQQIKSRNSDRHRRMVADTDKLVTLTKELKDQVETSDKPLEPNDVGKKAEEIEKLAKSVKDRMKG